MDRWEYQNKLCYSENRIVREPCKQRTACTRGRPLTWFLLAQIYHFIVSGGIYISWIPRLLQSHFGEFHKLFFKSQIHVKWGTPCIGMKNPFLWLHSRFEYQVGHSNVKLWPQIKYWVWLVFILLTKIINGATNTSFIC